MDYKEHIAAIQSMLEEMEESDSTFIKQLYIIIQKHLIKKGSPSPV